MSTPAPAATEVGSSDALLAVEHLVRHFTAGRVGLFGARQTVNGSSEFSGSWNTY